MTPQLSPTRTRPWLGLVLLLFPTAMVAIDMNVLFLALPALTADLHATAAEQLWISDIYALVVGVLVIAAGALGDRIGRRRLLLLGCAGFMIASIVAAFAPTATVLLLARAFQGVAGATLMPSTLALITELFPDQGTRRKAIAIWATCQFTCAALGPMLGGVVLHFFWWGSVFLFAVPACLAVLALGRRLLPERVDAARAQRIDLLSVALLITSLIALFITIKSFIPTGPSLPLITVIAVVVCLGAGAWFVRRQVTLDEPLLDLTLLKTPVISGTIAILILTGVALAGTALWTSQYLQSAVGLSPLMAAIVLAPMGLATAAGAMLSPKLAQRVPPHKLIPAGLLLSAAGALVMFFVTPETSLLPLITSLILIAVGCGPLFAFGIGTIVTSVPPESAGRAAGLSETSNYLGGSLGIAALGTLATSVYAAAITPTTRELPASVADSMAQSMATARAAALALPDHQQMLANISEAGITALHTLGLASAIILLTCAAIAHMSTRRTSVEK